jgi:GntR family transcriptional regulator/MocR family aminotransferase
VSSPARSGRRRLDREPGYLGHGGALLAASATIVPVPVDDEGLDVAAGAKAAPTARLAYSSPSHQLPLGVTTSLPRVSRCSTGRRAPGAWILEDDYDSEYRYGGRPLAAMQGVDASSRVIYVGHLQQDDVPALRVGYLVVPPGLIDPFEVALRHTGQSAPVVVQARLADFIDDGHFAAHVRRMRVLYAARQARFLRAARRHLVGLIDVKPADAGMHLLGELPAGSDDVELAAEGARAGLLLRPLSVHYLGRARRSGLLLGYAGVPEREIDRGVEQLAAVLRRWCRPRARVGVRSSS